MSDHDLISSYEGHKERRTGKIRRACSGMHRAVDGYRTIQQSGLFNSLQHKKRYDIVTDEEGYILVKVWDTYK